MYICHHLFKEGITIRILYLGWIGQKNVGDDLMFYNFVKLSKEIYGESCFIQGILPSEKHDYFNYYDLICLGGDSILLEGYINVLHRALLKGKKVIIWGSGYDDLLDDSFIHRIETTNVPAYIYSDEIEEKLNNIANNAEFFGVRGPLTYKILQKSNINMDKIIISGDSGFLLEPSSADSIPSNLKFSLKDKYIGVNFGTSFNNIYGKNESKILNDMIVVCKALINQGYKLYLYSMWHKDLDSLTKLYKCINMKEKVKLDLNIRDAKVTAAILKNCLFTINLKLHANIISAVSNTPFICLGYILKSHDLMQSINCSDLIITTDNKNLISNIMSKVTYITNNQSQIKQTLTSSITKYKSILKQSLH